jgi:hypothetical protein
MDIADKIVNVQRNERDMPLTPIIITKATLREQTAPAS